MVLFFALGLKAEVGILEVSPNNCDSRHLGFFRKKQPHGMGKIAPDNLHSKLEHQVVWNQFDAFNISTPGQSAALCPAK